VDWKLWDWMLVRRTRLQRFCYSSSSFEIMRSGSGTIPEEVRNKASRRKK
jgi:hypothetical protein